MRIQLCARLPCGNWPAAGKRGLGILPILKIISPRKQNYLSLRIATHNPRSGEFMDQMFYNSEGNEEQGIVSVFFTTSSLFLTCARYISNLERSGRL